MSNLQLRILSAVVLAAGALALTWAGGLPFRLLSAAIAAAIFYEWCMMARVPASAWRQLVPAALLAIVLVCVIAGLAAAPVLILFALSVVIVAAIGKIGGEGAGTAVGLAYSAFSGISLAFLRDDDTPGLLAILFLFATVWMTDILAYFVGRAIGGPKLAPAISPGKTWSGAVGGAVGGLLGGLAVGALAGSAPLFALACVALLLSVVSQIGDLFESAVKRRRGVKDSGRLIPGHGGVMDRVDGLVAASFALYVIGWAFGGGADHPARALFAV